MDIQNRLARAAQIGEPTLTRLLRSGYHPSNPRPGLVYLLHLSKRICDRQKNEVFRIEVEIYDTTYDAGIDESSVFVAEANMSREGIPFSVRVHLDKDVEKYEKFFREIYECLRCQQQ